MLLIFKRKNSTTKINYKVVLFDEIMDQIEFFPVMSNEFENFGITNIPISICRKNQKFNIGLWKNVKYISRNDIDKICCKTMVKLREKNAVYIKKLNVQQTFVNTDLSILTVYVN